MNKKVKNILINLILLVSSTILACLVVLAFVYFFAPHLLRKPEIAGMEVVQVDTKYPRFYEHIFNFEPPEKLEVAYQNKYYFKDPDMILRGIPLVPEEELKGPHDVLGFRNRQVPNETDIITLGDSMTYGNMANIENNWPSSLSRILKKNGIDVELYNAGFGSWSPVEYYYIFTKLIALKPRLVIVPLFSGNDALGSFRRVYIMKSSQEFKLPDDEELMSPDFISEVETSFEITSKWDGHFSDGLGTPFRKDNRNIAHPAVDAGYEIVKMVIRSMDEVADKNQVKLIYTILPTKELVYYKKIVNDGIPVPDYYKPLVEVEAQRIQDLKAFILDRGGTFVEVLKPMQEAALGSAPLYHRNGDPHPIAQGYQIIATTLEPSIREWLTQNSR